MSAIELRSLSKAFSRTPVLRDVSLSVRRGELLVLVGPSGCGKSTLLRVIAGLETPDAGEVVLDGVVSNDRPPAERDIGMVFQSYALYPHMTVRENMGFALRIRRTARKAIDARVIEVAELLGLEDLLERRPGALSGGQRQRVAMGRALVRRPPILLLDEPFSNLDAALRGEMRVELAALHRALGMTMVFVTHDQTEAMTLGERIVVLRNGEVEQVGAPMELYASPRNQFVAGFIGTPAMNFLPASLLRPLIPPGVNPTTIGVRPEDVILGGSDLSGVLEGVELLGSDAHAYVRVKDQRVIVRLGAERAMGLQHGRPCRLSVRADRLHGFDGSGRAVPLAVVSSLPRARERIT